MRFLCLCRHLFHGGEIVFFKDFFLILKENYHIKLRQCLSSVCAIH